MKISLFALLTLLVLVGTVVPCPALDSFPGERMAVVQTETRDQLVRLSDLGFDIATVTDDGQVTLVVDQDDVARLEKEGFCFQFSRDESSEALRARFTREGRTAADAGLYHTYDETSALLKEWAAKYPKLVKHEVIGKSFEKRDVPAIRISAAPAGKKVPKMLVQGMHHSREWISVEVCLDFARVLLEGYGRDAKITELLDNRIVWIVPIVNPDGYIWSQTEYSYWRKNRNDNNGDKYKGVDPNRNYGYQWGNVGASSSTYSDTYHGTGPFSEPCTQNIKRLAEREKFTADITHHSYGRLILYPWSYAYNQPCEDRELFVELARGMAKFNGHAPKESCDLYPSMGDTTDFMYGATRSLSFTFELGGQFIPAESEIAPICEANTKSHLWLLEQIGTVHAKNHPDHVSPLRFEAARLAHLSAVVDHLRTAGRHPELLEGALEQMKQVRLAMLELLDPAADRDGAVCRDLLALAGEKSVAERAALLPLLEDLKSRYLQENEGRNRRIEPRLEAIDALIPRE